MFEFTPNSVTFKFENGNNVRVIEPQTGEHLQLFLNDKLIVPVVPVELIKFLINVEKNDLTPPQIYVLDYINPNKKPKKLFSFEENSLTLVFSITTITITSTAQNDFVVVSEVISAINKHSVSYGETNLPKLIEFFKDTLLSI